MFCVVVVVVSMHLVLNYWLSSTVLVAKKFQVTQILKGIINIMFVLVGKRQTLVSRLFICKSVSMSGCVHFGDGSTQFLRLFK